ncbi:serine/Arginine-related protein 53 [Pogoniulus pusillus]|uniref:serine/Arginine-related protein 53 n=1 Tax=Pogoniulus pusillus TaxID=488313 RepID=UPI0030B95AB1
MTLLERVFICLSGAEFTFRQIQLNTQRRRWDTIHGYCVPGSPAGSTAGETGPPVSVPAREGGNFRTPPVPTELVVRGNSPMSRGGCHRLRPSHRALPVRHPPGALNSGTGTGRGAGGLAPPGRPERPSHRWLGSRRRCLGAGPHSAVVCCCLPSAQEGAALKPAPAALPLRSAASLRPLPPQLTPEGPCAEPTPGGDKGAMGRRSSDTEEESRRKKKHRRRSSSSSSSDSRSYSRRKAGRKSRSSSRSRELQSGSHSYEKRRRHRSSSSSSYGSRRKRSRSRSRGRGKSYRSQRSRSRSRTRRSRSRPCQRSYSRSSERSAHRRTRSGSRERRKGKEKGKGKEKEAHGLKHGDPGNIKAGLEHLTPAEQAKARLQLVLEAAAKADEALKAKERSEEEAKKRKEEDQTTLVEQVKRVKEIEAIESDSFVPQTFRSSKEVRKTTEPAELQYEPVTVAGGAAEPSAPEKEPPAANIPTAIKYQDDNSLAHPNLFMEKAEAEEKWFQRLVALRQERLMGSPVA